MEAPTIHKKMAAIMKSIGYVGKGNQNKDQKYYFRGIDDMYNALHQHFSENGVFILPEVTDTKREERQSKSGGLLLWTVLTVKYKFMAEDGSFVDVTLKGEAMDSSDKGCNKASSAALKYALIQMFLIPTLENKNADPDNETPEAKSREREEIDEALRLIALSKDIEDLKIQKASYPLLFSKNGEVKDAAIQKHSELSKSADNEQQ